MTISIFRWVRDCGPNRFTRYGIAAKRSCWPKLPARRGARLQALWALLQSIRQHAQDAIFTWSAKFTLPGRLEFPDPLLSRLAFFARYESLLRCLETRQARCEPRPVQLLDRPGGGVGGAGAGPIRHRWRRAGDRTERLSGMAAVTDMEAGRRAQLEYRDYASRAQLWQGRRQSDLALVGVTSVERDSLGTPTALTIRYHRPCEGDGPQPGQRWLLHPRFTDFTTDGVVTFLQTAGSTVHELFLRLLRDPSTAASRCRWRPTCDGLRRGKRRRSV